MDSQPYNLFQHITDEFYEQLQLKKWNERKEPIDNIIGIMEKNPKLQFDDSAFHRLIDALSKVLLKESNINVAASAATALGKIAKGLQKDFAVHAPSVAAICFNRLKEQKSTLRDPCVECLDACYKTTTFSALTETLKEALANKALGTRTQACEFFTRVMLYIDFPTAKKCAGATKEIVEILCKTALGSDPALRDSAMKSLAAFQRAVGKSIATPLLTSVTEDKLKMNKIEEYHQQFITEYPFMAETPRPDANEKKAAAAEAAAAPSKPKAAATAKAEDPILSLPPYDLLQHITDEFYEQLQLKKWNERKEPIDQIVGIMEKHPRLQFDDSAFHRLIDALSKVLLKESNINVAASAATALGKIAKGLQKDFAVHAPSVAAICFNRLKEQKPTLKDPCVECLDACYKTTAFSALTETLKEALNNKALGTRTQACEFFTRVMLYIDFPTAKKCAGATKEIVEILCKTALGSDPALRDSAMKSLAAFQRAVGKSIATPLLTSVTEDKLKMNKIEEYHQQFITEYPPQMDGPAKPAPAEEKKVVKPGQGAKPPAIETEVQLETDDERENVTPPAAKVVESPFVRTLNQRADESWKHLHQLAEENFASMPLESLLGLRHVVPRRFSEINLKGVAPLDQEDDEMFALNPKQAISNAVANLRSSNNATNAITSLSNLIQDSENQQLMAENAQKIMTPIVDRIEEMVKCVKARNAESRDAEAFITAAANFLLKFIPMPAIGEAMDLQTAKKFVLSLLELVVMSESALLSRVISPLMRTLAEHANVNSVLQASIQIMVELVNQCVEEESKSSEPISMSAHTKGTQLSQVAQLVMRVAESCEQNWEQRRSKIDAYEMHMQFQPISAQVFSAPKTPVKTAVCSAVQRLIKNTMLHSMVAAVRMGEHSPYPAYAIKAHRALLTRELNGKGEELFEDMTRGYASRLIAYFTEYQFQKSVDSFYGLYKHARLNEKYKSLEHVFMEKIRYSKFGPVIEEALEQMDRTLKSGAAFDVEEWMFANFCTGETLELYRATNRMSKMLATQPNILNNTDIKFDSDFLREVQELSSRFRDELNKQNGVASLFAGPSSSNAGPSNAFQTPQRSQQNNEDTVNLFRTISKPRPTGTVKLPTAMYENLQRHNPG